MHLNLMQRQLSGGSLIGSHPFVKKGLHKIITIHYELIDFNPDAKLFHMWKWEKSVDFDFYTLFKGHKQLFNVFLDSKKLIKQHT